jgi:hypothetical protein
MMINKSKLAFVAVVATVSMALPAFAQAATTTAYRHHYAHNRRAHNNDSSLGARAYGSIPGSSSNPADDPSMTGGGNMGFNACAGHARC